jgi:hypothetical protein
MQQIRITRTADLNGVLSFLKARYPLLSEAEIIKMALSNQYYQEAEGRDTGRAYLQDPTKHFTKSEWKKKFAVFEQIRERITPQDEERLDEAIDRAVREVRAEKTKAYERPTT